MKSRKLVTSRGLALMASRLVYSRPRHQQDEEAADEGAKRGGADTEPYAHCSQPSTKAPRWPYQWLKATVIFWTHALHDSDAYRDPRLA